ncbi:MAG: MOSC domain-containing protein [Anaerolineae bacterium]|nr:MOSC domain-containing protein [Anaerolineae bacterium]
MAQIVSIVYRPADVPAAPADHYARVELERADLVTSGGIRGDRKGRHPKRQLNVMGRETLDALGAEGLRTGPGEMGEQLVIAGLVEPLETLASGTRLQLGEQAVIELVEARTGCDRFETIQGRPATRVAGRLGVMARVVRDGAIARGDSVQVL